MDRPRTAFQTLFRLDPAPDETRPERRIQDLAAALEAETTAHLQSVEARGMQAFKAGTAAKTDDATEYLAQAIAAFDDIRDLDARTYVPCLLTVHAALAREQLILAHRALTDLVRRHPSVFRERPDLRPYFGDPKYLDRQMLEFVRAGEWNPKSVEAQVISAYCAWALRDNRRLDDALKRIRKLSAEDTSAAHTQEFVVAMQAALQ